MPVRLHRAHSLRIPWDYPICSTSYATSISSGERVSSPSAFCPRMIPHPAISHLVVPVKERFSVYSSTKRGEMLLDPCACTTDSCAVWFLGFACQRCTRHRVHIRCGRSALIPFPFLLYQERCEVSKLGNDTTSAAAKVEKPYQCFREREVL